MCIIARMRWRSSVVIVFVHHSQYLVLAHCYSNQTKGYIISIREKILCLDFIVIQIIILQQIVSEASIILHGDRYIIWLHQPRKWSDWDDSIFHFLERSKGVTGSMAYTLLNQTITLSWQLCVKVITTQLVRELKFFVMDIFVWALNWHPSSIYSYGNHNIADDRIASSWLSKHVNLWNREISDLIIDPRPS